MNITWCMPYKNEWENHITRKKKSYAIRNEAARQKKKSLEMEKVFFFFSISCNPATTREKKNPLE